MDGWMNGWMDGWMDGWTDGWMDGWTDGRTCTDGRKDRQTDYLYRSSCNYELAYRLLTKRHLEKNLISGTADSTRSQWNDCQN